jgi:hypothetical protein
MNRAGCPTLLHVVERPTSVSDDLDRAAGQAGFEVEHIDTVYGALAQLVGPTGRTLTAVIVCLDGLEAAELEFFTLAARLAPNTPLYVYGRSAEGQRQQRAVSLGARSEVSADQMTSLLASLLQETAESVEAPSAERASLLSTATQANAAEASIMRNVPTESITTRDESDGGRALGPPALAEEMPVPAGRSSDPGEAAAGGPPGVQPPRPSRIPTPWQPVGIRPQRVPPGARAPGPTAPGQAASDGESLESPSSPAEPLLTPQEIEALLRERSLPDEAG